MASHGSGESPEELYEEDGEQEDPQAVPQPPRGPTRGRGGLMQQGRLGTQSGGRGGPLGNRGHGPGPVSHPLTRGGAPSAPRGPGGYGSDGGRETLGGALGANQSPPAVPRAAPVRTGAGAAAAGLGDDELMEEPLAHDALSAEDKAVLDPLHISLVEEKEMAPNVAERVWSKWVLRLSSVDVPEGSDYVYLQCHAGLPISEVVNRLQAKEFEAVTAYLDKRVQDLAQQTGLKVGRDGQAWENRGSRAKLAEPRRFSGGTAKETTEWLHTMDEFLVASEVQNAARRAEVAATYLEGQAANLWRVAVNTERGKGLTPTWAVFADTMKVNYVPPAQDSITLLDMLTGQRFPPVKEVNQMLASYAERWPGFLDAIPAKAKESVASLLDFLQGYLFIAQLPDQLQHVLRVTDKQELHLTFSGVVAKARSEEAAFNAFMAGTGGMVYDGPRPVLLRPKETQERFEYGQRKAAVGKQGGFSALRGPGFAAAPVVVSAGSGHETAGAGGAGGSGGSTTPRFSFGAGSAGAGGSGTKAAGQQPKVPLAELVCDNCKTKGHVWRRCREPLQPHLEAKLKEDPRGKKRKT